MSPLQAIKEHCIDCCCGDKKEVKLCSCTKCPLYDFRLGKSGKKRNMTEEQKKAAGERLKNARESKSKKSE